MNHPDKCRHRWELSSWGKCGRYSLECSLCASGIWVPAPPSVEELAEIHPITPGGIFHLIETVASLGLLSHTCSYADLLTSGLPRFFFHLGIDSENAQDLCGRLLTYLEGFRKAEMAVPGGDPQMMERLESMLNIYVKDARRCFVERRVSIRNTEDEDIE